MLHMDIKIILNNFLYTGKPFHLSLTEERGTLTDQQHPKQDNTVTVFGFFYLQS